MNINKILEAEITKEPFPHSYVKKLFNDEEFEKLSSFAEKFTKDNSQSLNEQWSEQMKISQSKSKYPALAWYHDKDWAKVGFDPELGKSWEKTLEENREGILKHFGQHRFGKKGYYTQLFFNFSPPKAVFPIHHDTSAKVWTIAYYLWPENNAGTRLYDSNKKLAQEPVWEPNSGCAFSPQNQASWHDYHNPSDKNWRCVLIINICRNL